MDQTSVILARLEDVREDYKENQHKIDTIRDEVSKTREDVNKIAGSIVGQERCTEIMGRLNVQIQDVRLVCTRNEIEKGVLSKIIEENHEILVSRVDKLEKDKILNDLEPRIRCLEDGKIVVDYKKGLADMGLRVITSSSALTFITFLIGALVIGVWSPYVGELITRFGVPVATATLAAVVVLIYLGWKGRRKMAGAVEKGKSLKFIGV